MTQERTLVDVPEWITIEEAEAGPGDRYWHLEKVVYLDEHKSDGFHHIFAVEPHDADVLLVVSNGHETWTVPHEKPAGEPAANFAMWAKNTYTVWITGRDAATSERVSGFHMPFNHHVTFRLWWELAEVPADDATEPDEEHDLPTALVEEAEARQVMQFNPDAALQKAIFADGFVPNSEEFELEVADTTYVAQRAEHLATGKVRVYYVERGDWENVQHVVRPD